MELIGIIASVIAAVAAIASLCFSVLTSKGYLLKRINHKEEQIRKIDHMLYIKNGYKHISGGPITPLDEKRRKLEDEINELKCKL